MSRRPLTYALLVLFIPVLGFLSRGSKARPEAAASTPRPKLVIVIVIDQFRHDYLVRFRPHFVERGFNLLLGGANFVNCRYDYATTSTGPGHATLFTGAYPNLHGIVGNEWYDRSLGRAVNCIEDGDTKRVGAEGSGGSPRKLIGSTLGDELRLASDFESKVMAISLKDRGAILPGGHTANAAYWYDSKTGHFVSSTYYMPSLPGWVAQFNEQSSAKAYCGKPWVALPETPSAGGKVLGEFKPVPNQPCPSRSFVSWLSGTPFMNEIELNFAREAVKNERLGQGNATDLLAVSLSVNDPIGHDHGPYSREVADATLHTDRYLADFFMDLDLQVGLDKVWIALSADHGVAPTPRFVKEHRLGIGTAQPGVLRKAVEQALTRAFGQDEWIEAVGGPYIYLNQAILKNRQIDPAKAETVAAEAAASVQGVTEVLTRTQLLSASPPRSPMARKASNSFNRQRSGDILVVFDPYTVSSQRETSAEHGSPWNYDAQVPLVLWGSAFRPGVYATPCQTIDLAPTLAVVLGLNQPSGAEGQPLTTALK